MRAGRTTETIGALAGVALAVLVFLPWWSFDPASAEAAPGPPQLAPDFGGAGVLGAVDLYSAPDASAWDGLRNGAIVWLVTGGLGAALALTPRLGVTGSALRGLRAAALAAALVSLAIAIVRLADPPFAGYGPAPAAYAATVAIAVIGVSAAAALRRA